MTTSSLFCSPREEKETRTLGELARRRTLDELVRRLQPSGPLNLLYPALLRKKAKKFLSLFPGTVMYAVKCNPDRGVIQNLVRAGMSAFDVASIEEIRLIRKLAPRASLHFMHTVKSREAIREAYFQHGVRVFAIDSSDELRKIVHETNLAPDIELYVRLALPKNPSATCDFSEKFGAGPVEAAGLLIEARLVAARLGVMFHPGSQSIDPSAFRIGLETAADVIDMAGVTVDALDVGGGFPVPYPGSQPPPLEAYIETIAHTITACGLEGLELYCEPGRALVAEAGFLVARVELRKGDVLFLNDGIYGGMVEASKWGGLRFPVRLIRAAEREDPEKSPSEAFHFNGPTCDSLDMMEGPFLLPGDVCEGDWVEVSNMGAYSQSCRTGFNGFGKAKTILLNSAS